MIADPLRQIEPEPEPDLEIVPNVLDEKQNEQARWQGESVLDENDRARAPAFGSGSGSGSRIVA